MRRFRVGVKALALAILLPALGLVGAELQRLYAALPSCTDCACKEVECYWDPTSEAYYGYRIYNDKTGTSEASAYALDEIGVKAACAGGTPTAVAPKVTVYLYEYTNVTKICDKNTYEYLERDRNGQGGTKANNTAWPRLYCKPGA